MLVCTFPLGFCVPETKFPPSGGDTARCLPPQPQCYIPGGAEPLVLGSWSGSMEDPSVSGEEQNTQVTCYCHPGSPVSSPHGHPAALLPTLPQPGSPALTLGSHLSGPCSTAPSHSTAETRLSSRCPWDSPAGGHPLGPPRRILLLVIPAAGHSPL